MHWCRVLLLLCGWIGVRADAAVIPLEAGQVVISASRTPPGPTAPWRAVRLPDEWRADRGVTYGTSLWYRFEIDWSEHGSSGASALYIPYLNNGGTLLLNGQVLARLPGSDDSYVVRWVQPFLISIPEGWLQPGRNILMLHTVPREFGSALQLPALKIGDEAQLRSQYELRSFLVHRVPLITIVATMLVALLLLLIWWRRPQEQLYGLLGLSTLLWGVRTLTLVLEFLPVSVWPAWRVIYHAATGGFAITLALFVLRFSGFTNVWLQRALLSYWAVGPLALIIDARLEMVLIVTYWTLGLLLIACTTLVISIVAAARQRTWQAVGLCMVLSLTCVAGIHDFLVDRNDSLLLTWAPGWISQQIFLLHHTANLLLLVLTGILTMRFAQTLDGMEELNATLQQRVAEREQQLAANYQELSRLSRERAIEEERERLVRDMHDGLGSQLFTSLSRVQRNSISQQEMLEILRASITEMRLALDALAPADDDFQAVLGNFRYRWQADLSAAGITSTWRIDEVKLPAQQRLHVLRILQEALTNVLKHAGANAVTVCAVHDAQAFRFEVEDDGGGTGARAEQGGRGIGNMQARARRIGAVLDIARKTDGTKISLRVPRTSAG